MNLSTKTQSSFLKKCVLVGLGAIAVLANVSHQYPIQAPVINTAPFDNTEFARIMSEHAHNADPTVLHFAEQMTSVEPATSYRLYSRVCSLSDHGTQKTNALFFLRGSIAEDFNLPESSSFVKDLASVINVTVMDMGCDRTAPLDQQDLSSRD